MPQQNLEDFRRAFDAAVLKLASEKGSSTFLLYRKQYDEIVHRIIYLLYIIFKMIVLYLFMGLFQAKIRPMKLFNEIYPP